MSDDDRAKLNGQDESFYRRLYLGSPAAMVATDAQLNVTSWNPAAEKLFDRTAKQMVGKPLAEIAGQRRSDVLGKLLSRTLRDGETREFEVNHPGPNGQARTLLAVIGPMRDQDGRIRGVSAWVRDITNRRRLAERLSAAERMASLGTLAKGVAHHFNNIIGGVATFVDYALTTRDQGASRRALQMTAEATTRIAKITQSLLSFAEQDSSRIDLADLTEVVLTFVHLVERPLAERSIHLDLRLQPVPIIPVEANRMHQVLGNLLTNAEEAMPTGGTLTIRVGRDEQSVMVDFADTGSGIQPEHLPMVFEPFFTTKGLLGGGDTGNAGLGLSVVHGIITELGGEISVTSEPGKETCLQIRFPLPTDET